MRPAGFRTHLVVLAAIALTAVAPAKAGAAEAAAFMRDAERFLANGDSDAALAAADEAISAFWKAMPLHLRVAGFVEPGSVTQFSQYVTADGSYQAGDAMSVYLEPVGYGFLSSERGQSVEIVAGMEIRSPGGIVYARAPDFAQLGWAGRTGTRELHGTLTLQVPPLAPGTYDLKIDLTDAATGKRTAATLPFTVTAPPEDGPGDQS